MKICLLKSYISLYIIYHVNNVEEYTWNVKYDLELQLSTKEMEKAQKEYAKENGYENAEDLLLDCGLQYVTEEIYIEIVKDFLYEQVEKR